VNSVNAWQIDFGGALAEFINEANKMDLPCLTTSLAKNPGLDSALVEVATRRQ
jgi:hypothetical protein